MPNTNTMKPEHAALIAAKLGQLRDAGHGLRLCAHLLNQAGYKTPKGKAWAHTTVARALKALERGDRRE